MQEIHYRDAESGEYVTAEYAEAHPATTVRETSSPPGAAGRTTKESTMSEQPNQDLPKESGAKGRDNAAQKQAEAAERKAERDAQREADKEPHADQTLPGDL